LFTMLSRFANCVRIAPSLQRVVTPAVLRPFHSSRPVATTITIEERKGPPGTIVATPGIIDHYGAIPFVGLLATALITKEVFIFDEGALLLMNFVAVFTTAYIAVGNGADEFFEAERTKENNQYHELFDATLESVHLYKSIESKKLMKVDVIKDLCKESREVNSAYLVHLVVKKRHEARNAMVAKLSAIKKRESQAQAKEWQTSVTSLIDNVRDAYLDPKRTDLRAASLAFAIENIGDVNENVKEGTPRKVDPLQNALFVNSVLGGGDGIIAQV
jgi:hypothetical protein